MSLKPYITFEAGSFMRLLEGAQEDMAKINQHIVYMEEQGIGRSDDWHWEDMAHRLRAYFEDLRHKMQQFTPEVPFDDEGIERKPSGFSHTTSGNELDDLPF